MKKTLLFLTIVSLLFSCSNSDNSGNNTNNCQTLHPPTWIQGTWIKQNSPVGFYTGYKFTSDDVIDISSQSNSNSRRHTRTLREFYQIELRRESKIDKRIQKQT